MRQLSPQRYIEEQLRVVISWFIGLIMLLVFASLAGVNASASL